jgi:ABC-type nitrate/sulfonate/bicarbonate transport system substrate-binding protein
MNDEMTRRRFLRNGAVLLGGAGLAATPLLASCSSSSSGASSSSSPGKSSSVQTTKLTFQLGWLANVENMGVYTALDAGYYAANHLDVKVVPGGPAVSVEPIVVSGKALVGLDSADTIARARLNGAKLKIIAVTLQKNPTAVMSLAKKPIRTPQDLVGKKLGIQQSGTAIFDAFLKANHIDPKTVKYVPVQYDPSPLVNGQVDAFLSFLTTQPIQLKEQGIPTVNFLLADYHYAIWADTYLATESSLADSAKRAALVNLLRGSIHGWQDAIANPNKAVDLIVDKYGKSLKLNKHDQQLTAEAFIPLIETPETRKNGLLTMSQSGIDANIATMQSVGIKITAKDLFDTSLIEEASGH